MTYLEFIAKHQLSMISEPRQSNPYMATDMPRGSSHYLCIIHKGSDTLEVPFSMGPAHTEPPDFEDLLGCLASDAAGIENNDSFEQWAGDYGYDTDSRKAEEIYNTCQEQAENLKSFLGPDAYHELLWDIEE